MRFTARFWLVAGMVSSGVVSAVVLSHSSAGAGGSTWVMAPLDPVVVAAGSAAGGTVREVLVRQGQRVGKGQLLVRFDARELEARREQLAMVLRAAESAIESNRVTAGISAQVRRQLLESHPGVMDAEAEYAAALREFESADTSNRAGAKVRLDSAAAGRVEVRRTVGRAMASGGTSERFPSLLPRLRANIAEFDNLLRDAEVRAPADAEVDLLDVTPGQRIPPGHPVALLTLPQEYACEFAVPARAALRLKLGMASIGMLEPAHQRIEWRAESITRRTIPAAFREDRRVFEESVVRARVSWPQRLAAGTIASFELP